MSDPSVLRKLVQEVSAQPVPHVDWAKVEQGLFERLEREAVRPVVRRRPAWAPLVAVAAGAATIAAAAAVMMHVRVPQAREQARADADPVRIHASQRLASGAIDATTLRNGDRIVADASALTVSHPGHATWTLAGSSSVVVERTGPVILLELQSGMLRAEVVPRPDIESFAVRVGDTVVSVHGTIFTVEKRGDRALVQVQRGSVQVGPRSRFGHGAGWLMVAPASGSFSLDGARTAAFDDLSSVREMPATALLVPPAPAAPGPAMLPSPAPVPPSDAIEPRRTPQLNARAPLIEPDQSSTAQLSPEPVEPSEPELPEVLTEANVTAQLDAIRAQVADCHRRLAPLGDENVKVTVQTTLTLNIAPDGHMSLGRFDPPLAPEVHGCAASALVGIGYPKAKNASTLRLELRIN